MRASRRPARWSGRRLTSYLLLLTALGLGLSGVMLFLKPQGRVAHSLGWRLLWLSKEEWEELHTSISVLFLAAAGWHLWLNWRALKGYLKGFLARAWAGKAELLLAVGLLLLVWAGTLWEWAPFRRLAAWKAEAKAYWQRAEADRASVVPDADVRVVPADPAPARGGGQQGGLGRMSLAEFCAERGLDLEAARSVLRGRGLEVQGPDRFREVAGRAGLHPRDLEALLEGR